MRVRRQLFPCVINHFPKVIFLEDVLMNPAKNVRLLDFDINIVNGKSTADVHRKATD